MTLSEWVYVLRRASRTGPLCTIIMDAEFNVQIIIGDLYLLVFMPLTFMLPFFLPLQETQPHQAMKEPYGRNLAECPAEEDLLIYER